MADSILATARERLRREMNDQADNLATGACLSSPDVAVAYAQAVGKIEGLALAERCILDILDEIAEREKLDT